MATQPPAGGSAAWGDLIAQRARGVADSIARAIAYPAITPNLLTVVGFVLKKRLDLRANAWGPDDVTTIRRDVEGAGVAVHEAEAVRVPVQRE